MIRFTRRMAISAFAATAGLAAFSMPSLAHHSTAMFEWGKEVTIQNATVERWEWTNPHTFLYVRVPGEDGQMERWAFEGMSPNHLTRAGWSKRSLSPGEKINLTYYPLRDPRNGGFNVTVTKENGEKLVQLPER